MPIAAELFAGIEGLPIVSPHGHTDPAWFSGNAAFEDAVSLLIWPDHYLLRLLYSQGLRLESLGLKPNDGGAFETDRRKIWHLFAAHIISSAAPPAGSGWIMSSAGSSDWTAGWRRTRRITITM